MPQREVGERIARYGQGFSKILSTMRDDPRSHKINNTVMHHHNHDKLTLHHIKADRSSLDLGSAPENYIPESHHTEVG